MVLKHIYEGGMFFMIPIVILWITVLTLAILTIISNITQNTNTKKAKKRNNLVLFLGSFTFLLGITAQLTGLIEALKAIAMVEDISPALVAGGLRVSLIAPVYGFVLFFVSYIIWFLNRNYLIK